MFCKRRHGQTFIEYTLVIGILITALIAMSPMMRRGIQAMVKVTADQIGDQRNSDQIGGRFGQLINSTSYLQTSQDITKGERLGETYRNYNKDQAAVRSSVYLNQGFSPDN